MKFFMTCFLFMSASSFAMRVPPHNVSQKSVDTLNGLLGSKQKDVKIDVCDSEIIMDRHQRRLKKTDCCLQACTWACVTCIGLAALCVKLEYGCNCKQP